MFNSIYKICPEPVLKPCRLVAVLRPFHRSSALATAGQQFCFVLLSTVLKSSKSRKRFCFILHRTAINWQHSCSLLRLKEERKQSGAQVCAATKSTYYPSLFHQRTDLAMQFTFADDISFRKLSACLFCKQHFASKLQKNQKCHLLLDNIIMQNEAHPLWWENTFINSRELAVFWYLVDFSQIQPPGVMWSENLNSLPLIKHF